MNTHYKTLGVMPDVPQEIITAVYRTWMQALKVHPDLGGDEELAKRINEAYEVLRDPVSRSEYDAKIKEEKNSSITSGSRRAPRFRVSVDVAYCVAPDDKWNAARTYDASALGLRLQVKGEVKVGSHISIGFSGSTTPAVEATVKWSRPVNGGTHYDCGVEFFKPVADILERLGCQR